MKKEPTHFVEAVMLNIFNSTNAWNYPPFKYINLKAHLYSTTTMKTVKTVAIFKIYPKN
jgi:hypothetical protein